LVALLTSFILNPAGPQDPVAGSGSGRGAAGAAVVAEALPICSAMGLLAEGGDWAALDPDFAVCLKLAKPQPRLAVNRAIERSP
jgi:hypothetical protein